MISVHATTWAANRHDVGWAVLGLTWTAVFLAGQAFFAQDDTISAITALGAAMAAVVAVAALTRIGCRLAFVNR
ncbi:hypothetical protein F9L07_20745 [Pimelobacter simplex]|uniref:Uncharacterized protein n=1 Tax=Nocardioides simplex TaxID=2045 RepID=A0A7J5DWN7_NOCSI|nr:hypothetical protein [Pimelobacter simplex]KAB2809456.1 hypothetical protein F9L07_20745 [Pimelobacter simplex]